MNSRTKALFLTTAIIGGMALFTGAAVAQEASIALEEVVVTAERRQESAQRSSVAIEVFSQEQLQGVTQTQQLTRLTPGIQIGPGGPNPQVYIRGVGDNAANSRTQSAVAFNVDGVYVARVASATTAFFDLARVEVLKGPQGTLYGRNASGGAVNILTQAPIQGEFGGYVGAELGNFNLQKFNGAVNIPLTETLAVRAAFQTVDRDGYLSDGSQDQHTVAVRLRALWEPTDAISLSVSTDYAQIDGQGSGVVLLPAPGGDPWRSNTQQPLAYPFLYNASTAPYSQPNDRFIDSDIFNASAELNWDLGFATLTVLPAIRLQDQQYVAFSNNFRFYEDLDNTQTSVEVRLGGDTEKLKWVVGGYGFKEESNILLAPLQSSLSAVKFDTQIDAWALFGQATYSVTDSLRLIGGLRYTSEENSGAYQQGSGAPPLVAYVPTRPVINIGSLKAEATNWKVGLEYDIAPQSMVFLTAATGFKAGGFDQTTACGANFFDPEELTAYTLGSRNRFFGQSLQINAEVFHWEYEGQQVSSQANDACGGVSRLTFNVGDATIDGANVDVRWRLTGADTLSFALEYADGTYDDFSFLSSGAGAYAAGRGSRCSATPAGGVFFNINCSGQPIPRLADWTGSASYEHAFELSNGGTVTAGANLQFATERWLDFAYAPNGLAPAYTTYGADVTYTAPNNAWSATAWIENITEEEVYSTGSNLTASAPNGFAYYAVAIAPPRTYGLRLKANF